MSLVQDVTDKILQKLAARKSDKVMLEKLTGMGLTNKKGILAEPFNTNEKLYKLRADSDAVAEYTKGYKGKNITGETMAGMVNYDGLNLTPEQGAQLQQMLQATKNGAGGSVATRMSNMLAGKNRQLQKMDDTTFKNTNSRDANQSIGGGSMSGGYGGQKDPVPYKSQAVGSGTVNTVEGEADLMNIANKNQRQSQRKEDYKRFNKDDARYGELNKEVQLKKKLEGNKLERYRRQSNEESNPDEFGMHTTSKNTDARNNWRQGSVDKPDDFASTFEEAFGTKVNPKQTNQQYTANKRRAFGVQKLKDTEQVATPEPEDVGAIQQSEVPNNIIKFPGNQKSIPKVASLILSYMR